MPSNSVSHIVSVSFWRYGDAALATGHSLQIECPVVPGHTHLFIDERPYAKIYLGINTDYFKVS